MLHTVLLLIKLMLCYTIYTMYTLYNNAVLYSIYCILLRYIHYIYIYTVYYRCAGMGGALSFAGTHRSRPEPDCNDGYAECVSMLLAAGADPNVTSIQGKCAACTQFVYAI
jgi:hypothetical protein